MEQDTRNLLTETTETLSNHNKTWNEVIWVGHSDGTITIPLDQVRPALNFEYDPYFGNKVRRKLVIVGNNWWLERRRDERDDEFWEFKQLPVLVKVTDAHRFMTQIRKKSLFQYTDGTYSDEGKS